MLTRIARTVGALVISAALAVSAVGCSGSEPVKPTKEAVQAGLMKEMSEGTDPANKELYEKATTCIVDKIYDTLSPAALNAIADGDKTYKGSADDEKAIEEAANTCVAEITG